MARRAARRAASGAVTVASDSLQGVCADAPVEALPPHDEQAQLGQLLSKGSLDFLVTFERPILVTTHRMQHTGCTIKALLAACPAAALPYVVIDCATLVDSSHVYALVGERLFEGSPHGGDARTGSGPGRPASSASARGTYERRSFLEGVARLALDGAAGPPLLVVLLNCDPIRDQSALWTLVHLPRLSAVRNSPLRLLIVSEWGEAHFGRILDRTLAHVVRSVPPPAATSIAGGAPGRLLDVLLRNRTRPPQDFTAAAFRSIVGQVFSVCRDYVCDEQTLYSLVQRTIAHYRRVARTRNISLEEPSRLYQASQPFFRSLVNGEDLLVMQRLQVASLGIVERFLLLSAYIAAHNLPRYDLRIFGKAGGRRHAGRKGRRGGHMQVGPTRGGDGALSQPRAFSSDRLLGIFYFIIPSSPTPPLVVVQPAVMSLLGRGLLCQASNTALGAVRLDPCKYRCHAASDLVLAVAASVNFDIAKYLASNLA